MPLSLRQLLNTIKLAQWINMYDNNISLPANPDLHVLFTDDHIFVLYDQNSDLAKHIIILSRKKTYWQVWWSVFFCRFCWDHIVILNNYYCTTFRCHQIRPSSNGLAAQLLKELLLCFKEVYVYFNLSLLFIVLTDSEKSKKEKGKVCISTWCLTMWMQYYHYYYYFYIVKTKFFTMQRW